MDLARLTQLCAGNVDAARLCQGFIGLCEVYDDIVDGDHQVLAADAHATFWWALIDLTGSAFFRDHATVLRTAMGLAITKWKTANALERSGDREKLATAYTLRCSPYDFVLTVITLSAGPAAAEQAALALYGADTPEDRFDAYVAEHLEG